MGYSIDTSYITPGGLLAAAIVPAVFAIIAVILRFYSRRTQKAHLLWDDWLLIPGVACTTGISIALIIGVAGHGIGYTKGLPPGAPPEAQLVYLAPNIILTEKMEYAVQLMQILGLGFIKASVVLFYRRIFCIGVRDWFWYVTAILLMTIACWTIIFFFLFVFYCGTNIWAEWSMLINVITYCPNGGPYQLGLAISDFIMDIMIILLPVPLIVRLNIDFRRKLLVLMVFMLGLLAIAASLTRMVIFVIQMTIGFDLSEDGDKIISLILFWSSIENGAAIVAACLPTMRLLLRKSSLKELLQSIQSKFSLSSLRTSRSHSQPSTPADSESMTSEQKPPFERIWREPSANSHAERALNNSEEMSGVGGNTAPTGIRKHDSLV